MVRLWTNLIEHFVTKKPARTVFFLSRTPPGVIEKFAQIKLLRGFHYLATHLPAYENFLKENNIDHRKIKAINDFKKLPLTTKENYVLKYELSTRVVDSRLNDVFSIEKSSGYSGIPIYWPRLPEEDEMTKRHFEFGLFYSVQLEKHKTLFMVCFAMGTWPSGEKVSRLIREIGRKKKYTLAVMNPGPNITETLEIIKKISPYYEHTIIVGYPPFLKNLIEEGIAQKIDFSKYKITLVGGGEDNTENWRDYLAQKLNVEIEKPGIPKIYSNYGAVDVGLGTALEFPLTVIIRRLANQNKELSKTLFGKEHVPMLFQYNPLLYYIEEQNGEAIISCYNSTPVIRYAIRDRGGSIPYKKMLSSLKEFGIDILDILESKGFNKKNIVRLPFFYVYGRNDGTIIFRGANIYNENFQSALSRPELINYHTGNFQVEKYSNTQGNTDLRITIELKPNITPDTYLKEKFRKIILETIKKQNSEFRDAISHINYPVGQIIFRHYSPHLGIKNRYIA